MTLWLRAVLLSAQLMTFLGWLQCWEWFLHLLWHRAIISLTPHRVQLGFNRCWMKPYGTGIWVDAVARAVSTHRHDHPLWRRKRWMSFVRRLSRWSRRRQVRIFIQLEVYATDSDGKQLHKFPLNCPLNLDPSRPASSPCDGSLRHSTSTASKWMAASREHLRRQFRRAAFHHRTSRHRCHMRHWGRVCVGDGVGGLVAEVLAWWGSNGVG